MFLILSSFIFLSILLLLLLHLIIIHIISITRERALYGSIISRNSPIDIPDTLYRYRFCGFPTGVSILPRLADIVSITISVIIHLFFTFEGRILSTEIVKGTNVIKATSLVIIILVKNTTTTRRIISCPSLLHLETSVAAIWSNSFIFLRPAITDIRQKSKTRVR